MVRSLAKKISELYCQFWCKEDCKEITGTKSSNIHGSTSSPTCSSSCIASISALYPADPGVVFSPLELLSSLGTMKRYGNGLVLWNKTPTVYCMQSPNCNAAPEPSWCWRGIFQFLVSELPANGEVNTQKYWASCKKTHKCWCSM